MYQKILVPVDGSPTSDHGLDEAIRLAKLCHGRLRLLHVVDELSLAVSLTGELSATLDWLGMLREGGARILARSAERGRAEGLEVEVVLVDTFQQRIPDVVASDAAQWGAELIVIGTHGRRGAERLFLGSDAEQVLRRAPVPVLMVPARQEGATAA